MLGPLSFASIGRLVQLSEGGADFGDYEGVEPLTHSVFWLGENCFIKRAVQEPQRNRASAPVPGVKQILVVGPTARPAGTRSLYWSETKDVIAQTAKE
jgi:hypothetical protein